jgi:hypothetical protein
MQRQLGCCYAMLLLHLLLRLGQHLLLSFQTAVAMLAAAPAAPAAAAAAAPAPAAAAAAPAPASAGSHQTACAWSGCLRRGLPPLRLLPPALPEAHTRGHPSIST